MVQMHSPYMWFRYAFATSVAVFDGIGIQNVKPVNMQTAVRAYLFPLLDAGMNSPMRSMLINSMGCGGLEKCFFSNSCTLELNFAHVIHLLQCVWICFFIEESTFPVV